jgi:hypothetical protein
MVRLFKSTEDLIPNLGAARQRRRDLMAANQLSRARLLRSY